MSWEPAKFQRAAAHGSYVVGGYVYRGLGLHIHSKGSPKERRPPEWGLTHLGTGHYVCIIKGTVAQAFPIASEIAECSDWDFDGLKGWINRDPELPEKVRSIMAAHASRCRRGGGASNEEVAREIAMSRTP